MHVVSLDASATGCSAPPSSTQPERELAEMPKVSVLRMADPRHWHNADDFNSVLQCVKRRFLIPPLPRPVSAGIGSRLGRFVQKILV
jgi:hypothetical protein